MHLQVMDYWNKRFARVTKKKFIHDRTMINMQRRLGIEYEEMTVAEVEEERKKAKRESNPRHPESESGALSAEL